MPDPTFLDLDPAQRRLAELHTVTVAVVPLAPRTKPWELEAAVTALLRQVHVLGITIVSDRSEPDATREMAQALSNQSPSRIDVVELWATAPMSWKLAEGVCSASKRYYQPDLVAIVKPTAVLDPAAVDEAMIRLYSDDGLGSVSGTRAGWRARVKWPAGPEVFSLWRASVIEGLCRYIVQQELGFKSPVRRLIHRAAADGGWRTARSSRAHVHV